MSRLFVKTFGCTLNKKDTLEIVKNDEYTDDLNNIKMADYILINTCGVKEQTQTKIINFLKKIKEQKINENKIIIFGCLVDIDKSALKKIIPNARYFKVSEKEKIEKIIGKRKEAKIKETTKIIIISNGCLGNCYYCAVKFARGTLVSKPIKQIVKEIKKEITQNNAKEIYLTSQDCACYGKDINSNLVLLLKEIIKIKKDFKVRVGMGNPQHLLPILKDLIKIYKNKKIYKFLHVPIQSGENQVLKEMNRYYKIEDAFKIITEFKKNIKNITIATDIIVGYPTENNKSFKNTLKVIKKIKPDIINISRFGQRKNIEANKYKELSGTIKKERSRQITNLFEKICFENNKKYLNKTKEILITEKGKNNSMIGKTNEYKSVVVFENINIGEKIKVKINKVDKYYLLGNILKTK